MIVLPIEIINKIFLYLSSSTASLIKESEFYGQSFPFLYLEQIEMFPPINNVHQDYININTLVKQHEISDNRYILFHYHTNYANILISEQSDVIFIYNSIRRYRLTNNNDMEEYYEDLLIDNLDYLNNVFILSNN